MTAGGFAEIDPDAAEPVFAALETTGTTLANDWQNARAGIAADEGGIGGDEIARSFRTHYAPAREASYRTADEMPRAFQSLVDAGRASARDYITADARGTDALRHMPPGRGPR
ncbi:hypothetical protein CFN78_08345 [Amycolatopsis antarctica]|uniref:Uncharacterized protein n=1 Tax=Amycolatopsis antarctica TaxID=1854586 RepID=A0A263D589_9PSEU|nr:hypothetical protein [Amycolatopsis antarctica]OZM73541.1 hypothetical protein CFN78_08345 [Amycolatopsis antarctica]